MDSMIQAVHHSRGPIGGNIITSLRQCALPWLPEIFLLYIALHQPVLGASAFLSEPGGWCGQQAEGGEGDGGSQS